MKIPRQKYYFYHPESESLFVETNRDSLNTPGVEELTKEEYELKQAMMQYAQLVSDRISAAFEAGRLFGQTEGLDEAYKWMKEHPFDECYSYPEHFRLLLVKATMKYNGFINENREKLNGTVY